MLKFSKISPIARAVGVMGATAALVTGVTFANLTSNVVALTPNNIAVAGASLAISANAAIPETGCTAPTTSTQGIQAPSLAPGATTPDVTFCLKNTGAVSMSLTASIPQDLSGSVAAQNTTLTVTCGDALAGTLSGWGPATFTTHLNAGASETCTAHASLSSSYAGSGNEAIPGFTINFVGTQV
jgi:hypothetical protein